MLRASRVPPRPIRAKDDLSMMQTRGNGHAPHARLPPPSRAFSQLYLLSISLCTLCKARRFISAREPRLGLSDRVLTNHQAELYDVGQLGPGWPRRRHRRHRRGHVVAVSRAHLRRLGAQRAFFKRPSVKRATRWPRMIDEHRQSESTSPRKFQEKDPTFVADSCTKGLRTKKGKYGNPKS